MTIDELKEEICTVLGKFTYLYQVNEESGTLTATVINASEDFSDKIEKAISEVTNLPVYVVRADSNPYLYVIVAEMTPRPELGLKVTIDPPPKSL